MRIKAIVKRVWGFKGKTTEVTYQDEEKGRIYGRIIDGFAWPWAEKPGAVVTIAESHSADHSLPFSPRHLWILEEFFSSDLEELYRACLRHRDHLCVKKVKGNPHNSLKRLWSKLGDEGGRIYISEPPSIKSIDLNYVIQLVRKRTSLQKTLHFGEGSSLPGYLSTLREEEIGKGNTLERCPPIAALGYCLSLLEKPLSSGQYTPTRARRLRVRRR